MSTTIPPPEGIVVEGIDTTGETFRAAKPRAARARGRPRKTDAKPIVEEIKPSKEDESRITPGRVEEAFGQLLSLPALVYKAPTPWHCDFCAKHFADQGPVFAKELVEGRAAYPALYAAMEKIAAAWMAVGVMPGLIAYAGPPIIHHGPETLQPMAPLFGVPERPKKTEENGMNRHEHTSASAGTVPRESIPPTP